MKKWILGIVIALLVGGATGVIIYERAPQNVIAGTVRGFYEDVLDREEIRPVHNVLTQGSVFAKMDECRYTYNGSDLMANTSFSGKLYFDDVAVMVEDAALEMEGIVLAADLYVSDEMLFVSEDKMFEDAYGIVYKTVAEEFRRSIFAYGSGSDYAIQDKEIYDMILNILESLGNEDMKTEGKALIKEHAKPIFEIFLDNLLIKSKNDEIRIGKEKQKVRVVTIEADGEALARIVRDLYDYLMEDDTIEDFLNEYADVMFSYLEMQSINIGTADTLGEFYRNELENLSEDIDDLCDELEDNSGSEIKISIVTPRMSKKLLKLSIKTSDGYSVSLDFGGKQIKKARKITLEVGSTTYLYEITQNDKRAYESVLECNGETLLSVKINKDRNTFDIEAVEEVRLKGTFGERTSGGKRKINLNKVILYYWNYQGDAWILGKDEYLTDLEIIYDEKDEMPAIPKNYRTIDELTDAKIAFWISKIESELE